MIKNPVKMVLVKCLIICSKFARNCLSARLHPDPLGALTALPRPSSWIMGKGGEIVMEGGDGKARGRGERRGRREGVSLRG